MLNAWLIDNFNGKINGLWIHPISHQTTYFASTVATFDKFLNISFVMMVFILINCIYGSFGQKQKSQQQAILAKFFAAEIRHTIAPAVNQPHQPSQFGQFKENVRSAMRSIRKPYTEDRFIINPIISHYQSPVYSHGRRILAKMRFMLLNKNALPLHGNHWL